MNQTFNLKRFSLLFKKHTADNYKTYVMAFFVLLGVLFLVMSYVAYMSAGIIIAKTQIPIFIFLFLISGTIFTSITFADFGNKKKAIGILTLPASHFEKYLVGWTYSFIIFQLLFTGAFYLIAMLINQAASLNPRGDLNLVLDLFSKDEKVYIVFYIFTALHAFILWGSIFFKNNHWIKTAFALFIAGFVIVFLNLQTLRVLIDAKIQSAIPFTSLQIPPEYRFIAVHNSEIHLLITLVTVVFIVWVSAFYKLKEKEV